MQAVAEAPRIAKATVMHDGLLVEFRSGLVIFYRDAFWEQQNYALARRAAVERQPWVARESAATEAEEQQP